MPGLIENCLARLVRQRKITQAAADGAFALYTGTNEVMLRTMPAARADAEATLAVAKAMAESATKRRTELGMRALRQRDLETRVAAHPRGQLAGLAASLQHDIFGANTPGLSKLNVEGHTETITADLFDGVGEALKPFESKMAGLVQDIEGAANIVDDLFAMAGKGAPSGNAKAAIAATGWKAAVDKAVARAQRAGRNFAVLEDWLLPQHWERRLIEKHKGDFVPELLNDADAGNITIMDKASGLEANAAQRAAIAEGMKADIIKGTSRGASGRGFNREMRVIRFNNAATWKKYNAKYGTGQGGIYGMMTGHIRSMARDIALTEVFGPQHRAVFNQLHEKARLADQEKRPGLIARTVTGPRMVELAYKDLTGELSAPMSDTIAGIWGALRSWKTATSLGSATISAVPGDAVTMMWAARHNGIPASAVIRRYFDIL
jgi:hypothetical protein